MSFEKPLWIAFAASTVVFAQPVAHACSASPCYDATLFPGNGDVPSDQARWSYTPPRDFRHDQLSPTIASLHAYVVKGETRTEITLQSEVSPKRVDVLIVTPKTALEPGSTVVFEDSSTSCLADARPLTGTFQITAPAPKPATLGPLSVDVQRGSLQVATNAGSCHRDADVAYADLAIELPDSARPFASVFTYGLYEDGSQIPEFRSALSSPKPLEPGHARVFISCEANAVDLSPNVSPGTHRFRLRGTLPDGSTVESEEAVLDLTCGSGRELVAGAEAPEPQEPEPAGASAPAQEAGGEAPAPQEAEPNAAAGSGGAESQVIPVPSANDGGCSIAAPRAHRVFGFEGAAALWLGCALLARKALRRRRC